MYTDRHVCSLIAVFGVLEFIQHVLSAGLTLDLAELPPVELLMLLGISRLVEKHCPDEQVAPKPKRHHKQGDHTPLEWKVS